LIFWGKKDVKEEGWLSRLTSGLSKSADRLASGLDEALNKQTLDEATLSALEDLLIESDLGPQTAAKIIRQFSEARFGQQATSGEVRAALASQMAEILKPVARPLEIAKPEEGGPFVILVCGVNGAGKTTTIGKLAHDLVKRQGKSTMIAAGDTFRAAAIEQLAEWASRCGAGFYAKDIGADAAALAYESYEKAKAERREVLLIDTAGRLHNKTHLMEELAKVLRVLRKQNPALPHAVLLVLDSTTGQNAFAQTDAFRSMVDVTGLIVTKLDGSAKGGVVVGLADRYGLPIHAIGVGEGIEDLQPFEPEAFARGLLAL
jgi:fused signal recognition particle receptor